MLPRHRFLTARRSLCMTFSHHSRASWGLRRHFRVRALFILHFSPFVFSLSLLRCLRSPLDLIFLMFHAWGLQTSFSRFNFSPHPFDICSHHPYFTLENISFYSQGQLSLDILRNSAHHCRSIHPPLSGLFCTTMGLKSKSAHRLLFFFLSSFFFLSLFYLRVFFVLVLFFLFLLFSPFPSFPSFFPFFPFFLSSLSSFLHFFFPS